MDIFYEIKNNIKPTDVAKMYLMGGKYTNGSMWYRSPFRVEKTASFCFNDKKGIHDFGNGKHYDVISFVQEMFNEKPYDAAKRIINDFRLPINLVERNSKESNLVYEKKFAKYKFEVKKEKEKKEKEDKIYEEIKIAIDIVYGFWNKVYINFKNLDIDIDEDLLYIIYKNKVYFEGIWDIIEVIPKSELIKDEDIIKTIKRGIIYMDFEKISLLAYNEEEMPKSSTNIERLVYYQLKDLYNKHQKKYINEEDAKKEKNKIKVFYEKQNTLEEFNKKLQSEIVDNIKNGERYVIQLTKAINQKAEIKELLDIAIKCISNLTEDKILEKNYEENY